MHQASIAETKLETETERRINKQLADQITKIAKSNGLEGWSFAAPVSCHNAIIELLAPDVRNRIVESGEIRSGEGGAGKASFPFSLIAAI